MKIGFISFAHMHAYAYAEHVKNHPDADFAAIWDADETRGKEAANQYGAHYYHDLEAFLKSDMDAVIICSENANHKQHVLKAAGYKKDILVEKPIATEVEDAIEMINVCEEQNVKLQVAYPARFIPAIQETKELLLSGEVGEVIAVNATNQGQMPGGWFIDKTLSGGGSATDHIVHIMDLLRWIFNDEAKKVYAEFDTRFHDIDVEDCGSVILEMESGKIISIDPSWSRPKVYPTWGNVKMDMVGTKGTLSVDAFKQKAIFYDDQDGNIKEQPWADDMNQGLINDFIQCVKNDTEPFITGQDGLRTLEVVKAAYKSDEEKASVAIERR